MKKIALFAILAAAFDLHTSAAAKPQEPPTLSHAILTTFEQSDSFKYDPLQIVRAPVAEHAPNMIHANVSILSNGCVNYPVAQT
jgi:hypothetical protein